MKPTAWALLACMLVVTQISHAAKDESITLNTPTGELHGSLTLPAGRAPHPVALLIAGSGPTDRDGNNPAAKNDSLKMVAHALAEGGIACVRYDKRGIAASAAAAKSEADLRFRDLVEDAAAWIRLLAKDPRFTSVSVIGHSEGSTIGMMAAQDAPVRTYVSIAGPQLNASAVLRTQLAGKLPPALAQQSEQILVALERGERVDAVPPPLLVLYRPSVQPYLIDWFKVHPLEEIKKLRIPVLILQGDTDIQIPVSAAQALHVAKPEADLVIVEGMNHVLKLVPNDQARQVASYSDPSLPVAPALNEALREFLLAHTGHAANR
jgi:pimeloyl-ACP methyl ester carboxylesterase